jgi:putative oxygen-independent coproporphyrinogen III oxidase
MPVLKTADLPHLPSSDDKGPAAIYVHWPFCLKKCPYCDFNSHVRDTVSHKDWCRALVREVETFAAHFPNLHAKSIFFGGGTPSLMEPETVAAVIAEIKKSFSYQSDIEITLEANPSSVEAGRFRAYRNAGINRLSVGIQSLDDRVLKFLGRLHSAEEALTALKVAQDTFDRVSFDLIYARPEQSLDQWRAELTEALSFGTSHLSLYQLTIEEGTAFYHQFRRGKFSLPNEDQAAALFELTQDLTAKAGLPAYETSNHARAGEQSQHNLAYWQGDPYVGIGPGAHGRLPGKKSGEAFAHAQIKRPEDWLKANVSRGTGLQSLETVSAEDRAVEAILTGLRLTEGIDLAEWRRKFGQDFTVLVDQDALADMQQSGHLTHNKTHLKLTQKGRPLLNFILGKLVA